MNKTKNPDALTQEPINGIKATLCHDEGAIARCAYCGRYTLDHRALGNNGHACKCGKTHGWSGSFIKPGPAAKWSGDAPQPAASVASGGEFDLRGTLASKLICWHRLTVPEVDNLLEVFDAATAQLQPRTPAEPSDEVAYLRDALVQLASKANLAVTMAESAHHFRDGFKVLEDYAKNALAAGRTPVAQPAPVQITEEEAGIHSIFNACMFRDECRARAIVSAAPTPPKGDDK